jgi:hypothetical protein
MRGSEWLRRLPLLTVLLMLAALFASASTLQWDPIIELADGRGDKGPWRHADAPRLALDRRGVLHLVYAESANGTKGPYRIRYTRSPAGAAGFEAPRTLPALAPHDNGGAAYPEVALDGQGVLYVTWEAFPNATAGPRGLGITFSSDNGNTFAPPILVPGSRDGGGGTNGSHQGLLGKKLAVSRSGRIAVANSSLKLNDRSRVWLMRGQLIP